MSARLPKNFMPEKYTITFIPDYSNLKYTINAEILIESFSVDFPYLILNASETNYKINSLLLYNFDNIADEWHEIGKDNTNSNLHSHLYFFHLDSEEEKKYEIQEGLYIPINNKVNKGEKLKLIYSIEGTISCDMKNALYLGTNLDEKKELFNNKNKFKEEWEKNYQNLEKKPNLSEDKFLKNLVLIFIGVPFKFHLNMPGFDEPCFKAVYSFNLELDKFFVDSFKEIKCITNGSLIHVKLNEEKNKYIFKYSDSPLMSSYLFTFVIGNYDLIETVNENKIKLRVFTPIKAHHDGALCMNLAQYSLKFYEKFFDIPYFYEKLDFVPVPSMNYRAMENLGCIIFKNEAMLFSHFQHFFEKKFISRTISHEISHMWFGDLVTMEWWDDIWLNEGFARIFEYLCLNDIQSNEFNYWDNYIYYIYDKALIYDESTNTHPIVRKIDNVNQIDTIFDTISYSKGSSVIKMLMNYIGIDNFKKSISLYLKKYKYKNTHTSMLWECFNEVSKLKVSELMNEWVNFSGHPILSIDIISKEDKYYFKLNQKSTVQDDKTIWKLPVFMKSKHFEICRLIQTEDYEISFEELNLNYSDIKNGDNFVVFNSDLKGFYRVKYDNEILLNSILKNYQINSQQEDNKKEDVNKVSDHDIFGLLSYEFKMNNLDNIKKILSSIKCINKSELLLTYIKDIYEEFKQKICKLEGFEEFIDDQKLKEEEINKTKEFDNFFISLVDNNNLKLMNLTKKFFINEGNKDVYRNQYNDEFDTLYLYYRCIIGDGEEIGKIIFTQNILKNFEFINKNFKYIIIEIALKYIYLLKDDEEKKKLIDTIIKDYNDNYYSSSYYIRKLYSNAISNFGSLDESLFFRLYSQLLSKSTFTYTKTTLFHGKKSRRLLFDGLLNYLKKQFSSNESNLFYENYYAYLSSPNCRSYLLYLKLMWINEKEPSSLAYDTLLNYFKSKFGLDFGGENELFDIVNDFSTK